MELELLIESPNPMVLPKPRKTHYSDIEAARALGVTIEEFHDLIRYHIAENDEDIQHSRRAVYHASDLLVLRLLSNRQAAPTARG